MFWNEANRSRVYSTASKLKVWWRSPLESIWHFIFFSIVSEPFLYFTSIQMCIKFLGIRATPSVGTSHLLCRSSRQYFLNWSKLLCPLFLCSTYMSYKNNPHRDLTDLAGASSFSILGFSSLVRSTINIRSYKEFTKHLLSDSTEHVMGCPILLFLDNNYKSYKNETFEITKTPHCQSLINFTTLKPINLSNSKKVIEESVIL